MFGRTGHNSSRIIFGGAAFFRQEWGQDWAEEMLDLVLAAGVNHLDTAASYGDSEQMMGPWLSATNGGVKNRDRIFLASKTGEREGRAARAELELSLERLQTDHVDLIQIHNLVEEDDWAAAHSPGGVLEALIAARDEGLVSAIGVTGHGVRIAGMHLRSLDEFDYDSVLLPYNTTMLQIPTYRDDVGKLLDVCAERNVAVQTIKAIARRRWSDDSSATDKRSWYEPLQDQGAIERSMRVALAEDQLFLNTSSDARLMSQMLAAAESIFSGADDIDGPDAEELAADIEAFGMAALFDGAELERI